MKLFLSFASEDLDFIQVFYNRLRQLEIDIWDYSNRGQEISLGEIIKNTLESRILDANFFIPVISINSVDEKKWYTHFEVQFAIDNNKKILPVVLSKRQPIEWTGSYNLLKGIKYLKINYEDENVFEESICELCSYLNIVYKPVHVDPYKLPLFKKFQKEIELNFEKLKTLERWIAISEELLMNINRFNYFYGIGNWEKSLSRIINFLQVVEDKVEITDFYYPQIVKGVCELELNLLDDAKKTFLKASKDLKADENAFGGLGQVYFRQRKYKDALNEYKKALLKCPENEDTEVQYNILLTAIEVLYSDDENLKNDTELFNDVTGIINETDWIQKIRFENYIPKDKARIKYLIGLANYRINNFRKALDSFQQVYNYPIAILSLQKIEDLEKDFFSLQLHEKFKESDILIPVNSLISKVGTSLENAKTWIIVDGTSIYILKKITEQIHIYYRELSLIIDYAELLNYLGCYANAINLLNENAGMLNNRYLYQRAAVLYAERGNLNQAKKIYQTHLCKIPFERQFLIEYALILKSLNETSEVRKICEQVIGLGNPENFKEWYYQGFAYFLSGNKQTAAHYYLNSNNYDRNYALLVE